MYVCMYVRLHSRIHKDIDTSGNRDRLNSQRHVLVQAAVTMFTQLCHQTCHLPQGQRTGATTMERACPRYSGCKKYQVLLCECTRFSALPFCPFTVELKDTLRLVDTDHLLQSNRAPIVECTHVPKHLTC